MSELHIYNTLTGQKELFVPIVPNRVGIYVCGPTLYSDPHMGNLRTFINFDMIYRYFLHLGYQVKYVRNITDCGHITNSRGVSEDAIGKAAKLEQVQSLEIVYKYNLVFQELQRIYNLLPPSIEPTATAHIQEQIEIIEKILENGYAYVTNGSVYFDVRAYNEQYPYGVISGRKLDELQEDTRDLNAQDEKRYFADFALWKKATPEDMQIWRSPWGDGNPGWHIECTAMSTKYLGEHFDIHGGGMDLKFPHHENEVAQSCGSYGVNPANYWLHANMLNVNGQKMSKSLGNSFLPKEIVEGSTTIFSKPFSVQVIRFFMMMGHYRSDLDFSNEALLAAERGYLRLQEAFLKVEQLSPSSTSSVSDELQAVVSRSDDAMNDDFNTARLIAEFFELATMINKIDSGDYKATAENIQAIQQHIESYFVQVLGIDYRTTTAQTQAMNHLMDLVLDMRRDARERKDYSTSDKIRDYLTQAGIELKDGKEGTTWKVK